MYVLKKEKKNYYEDFLILCFLVFGSIRKNMSNKNYHCSMENLIKHIIYFRDCFSLKFWKITLSHAMLNKGS